MTKWIFKITNAIKKLSFNKKLGWELLSFSFLVAIICFSVEKESIKDLIELTWYEPIVQHINKSLIGLIFSTISMVCIFSSFIYLKKETVLIYLNIVVIILYVRTMEFWQLIDFGEITFIPLLIPIVSIILKLFLVKRTDNQDSLNSGIQDSFKRTNFAESIVEEIKSIKVENLKGSFNYGLIGEWGSGKTFLLNMIHEEMKNDDSLIATVYKPWETPQEDQFYKEIISRLKGQTYNEDIVSILNKYSLNLEANSQDIFTRTIASLILWLTGKRASLDQLKKDISDLLQKKHKRMVIFLDDLDRLNEHEIREVLRLLRNTFDIPSLFFIVGFDRDYLSNTLKLNDQNHKNFDRYIAKFFQARTNIPKIESQNLQEKYFRELKSFGIFIDEDYSQILQKIGDRILALMYTPRDFENIFDSFRTVYNNLKEECDWFTLLQLEIIRHKEYMLYFILLQSDERVFFKNPELLEKWTEDQKTYYKSMEEVMTQIGRNSDIYGIYNITNSFYYFKYFTFVNREDEISFKEFKANIESPHLEGLKNQLIFWYRQGKKYDLNRKIDNYLRTCKLDKSPEFLITIDLNLEKGVKKSNVNESVITYINRIFLNEDEKKGIDFVKNLQLLIPKNRIAEMLEYYFFTNDLQHFKSLFFNLFDDLLESERISINKKLYIFLFKLYTFLNGDYINYNLTNKSISIISRNEIDTFHNIIDSKLSVWAKNSIKSFLLNFIVSNNSLSETSPYGFFDSFVPRILSYDDCIDLLNQLPDDQSKNELIDFIEKLKEKTSKSIEKWIPYEWKYNIVLRP